LTDYSYCVHHFNTSATKGLHSHILKRASQWSYLRQAVRKSLTYGAVLCAAYAM